MKKLFTLLTMLVIGIGSVWATVDTQIIKVSTSTSDPEHVYFMHSLENDSYFATQEAYASNTAARAAKFAFFQATDANGNVINNAYYIYCVNNSKWMSYSKAASYPDGQNFVTMTTNDKTSANYFNFEHVSMTASSVSGKKAYLIHPYNTSGPGSRCLNWYNGVTGNTSSTIGLYTNGAGTAGNGWAFIEAPRIGRYYRIKSYASNKYLATSSATDETDNTTLYCYTDKGLAQISSGKYYNGSGKAVGTTQYPVTIQPNVNGASGALQFMTNGYWAYSNSTGVLDRGSSAPDQTGYAWYFEEVTGQFPFTFAATLNDIQDAKWYNLNVREKYVSYNSDGTFHDTATEAPQATDKTAWFAFVGDPFRGFQIVNFASAALFGSSNVNTNTRIKAVRPSDAATYVFEIVSYNNNLAWHIRDKRGENAFLNQQGTNLGIWNHNARGDIGNVFVITEVEDAVASYFVTYNVVAKDANEQNEISWGYDRLYGAGQTTGETPESYPFIGEYSCADPTLSRTNCNLTYTATHTMPFIPATSFASAKPYFMKQRKNNESAPKYGYAYYDSERSTSGMPKTKTLKNTENYVWAFVGNPYDGYKIYNKAKGDAQGLCMTSTGSSLTWNGTPSAFTLHTMSTSDPNQVVPNGAASTYFKLKGSANNCLHDLSGVLNNWNNGGAVTDAGTIIGFYEAEEYNIVVSGADNGRIIINGTEYANGNKYFNMKGESFTSSAKDIANYKYGTVTIENGTISVTYTEATTVNFDIVYRYKENDEDDWQELRTVESVPVAIGEDSPVAISLTAEETLKFTGGTYQIGEGETSDFTMCSFAEVYNGNISIDVSETATLYINLRVRPLPTTGKLYRFYNVSNSAHWMYNNGTRLGVTANRKSDKSDMFYLLETGTSGVYKFVSALNGDGYNEVTWQDKTNPVKFERTGRITFDRYTTDKEFSILIGQNGKSGTKQYLHANGSDDGHSIVVWENTIKSRWYAEEVPISEIADPELEIAKIEANRILNKRGVGYPTTSSSAYSALNTAINANNATVESINTAVTTYKSVTTDIQMPEDGKTYTITAVAKDDTKRFYMKYASSGYTLNATTGLNDGSYPNTTYLTCKKIGEKYAFVNNEGKYFIFKGSDAGANDNKGYLDEYNSSHNFTVSRMLKTSNCTSENDAYIGYVYMVGFRDNNTAGCFVHKPNGDYDQASVPFFNDNYSSALVLDEVVSHTLSLPAKKSLAKIDIAESGKTFAEGLGNYHVVAGGEISYDANSSISEATTNAEVDEIIASVDINQPTPGYYRIQNKATSRYVNCTKVDNTEAKTSADTDGDNNSKTIFYIDSEKDIQAYDNGAYWKGVYRMGRGTFDGGTYGTLTYKHPWQFVEGNSLGTYKLIYGNDTEGKYHATGVGEVTGYANLDSEDANADKATWTLIAVTELPARTEGGSSERGNEITIAPAGTEVNENVPNVLVETSTLGTYTCNNLQLNDDIIPEFGTYHIGFQDTKVTYTRNSSESVWGTICLPYATSTEGDVSYYRLVESSTSNLRFEKISDANTTAYEPYLIKKEAGAGLSVSADDQDFTIGVAEPQEVSSENDYKLQGVLVYTSVIDGKNYTTAKSGYVATTDANAYYFDAASTKFCKLNGRFNLKAFRAYLTTNAGEARPNIGFDLFDDDQPTGVNIIESEDGNTVDVIFDLNGRRLQNAKKGINIINGKKVIK